MIYWFLAFLSYPFVAVYSRFFTKRLEGSILIFQTAKIGDMVCTTPVFRELKKAHPKARIGVVIDRVAEPILRHNPYIDEIIVYDRQSYKGLKGKIEFAKEIYRKGYSSALILMPNTASVLAAYWGMIPKRVTIFPDYAGRTQRKILNLNTHFEYHLPPRMAMETYLRSLRHFSIEKWDMSKEIYAGPGSDKKVADLLKAEGPYIALVLGAGNSIKEWGKDNFLTLSGRLIERTSHTLVLIGMDKDAKAAEEIIGYNKGSKRIVNLCGALALAELPALLKRMALVVGVDTGLIYMADALSVPVVVIAGPCDMSDQRPTGKAVILQIKGVWGCVPCSHTFLTPYECRYGHKRCTIEITPEDVFKGISKLLPSAVVTN